MHCARVFRAHNNVCAQFGALYAVQQSSFAVFSKFFEMRYSCLHHVGRRPPHDWTTSVERRDDFVGRTRNHRPQLITHALPHRTSPRGPEAVRLIIVQHFWLLISSARRIKSGRSEIGAVSTKRSNVFPYLPSYHGLGTTAILCIHSYGALHRGTTVIGYSFRCKSKETLRNN